ncbi:MAG TPA: ATP-binding protein [Candidatus Saccharimonadales bacterium]|nr:ATP-binding protein [Candidatus Saccharimonadales bacterium]
MSLIVVTSWLAAIAAIMTASVGIIVWFAQKRNSLRWSFLVLSLFIGLWIISNVVFAIATDAWKYPIALLSYAFAMGVAVHLLLFSLRLAMGGKKLPLKRQIGIASAGYVIGGISVIPGVVASGVQGSGIITNIIALGIYGLVLGVYLVASSVVLVAARRRVRYVSRQQVSVVLLGMAISSIAGAFFNLILPLVGEYRFVQLGPASAVLFVSVVAYVIVRHKLFDVRLAIVRSIVYFLILTTLTGLYFGLAYIITSVLHISLLSPEQMVINVVIALVMALSFQPIKRFFDRLTNRLFYRDNYSIDDFIRKLSRTLTSTTDLRSLLQRAAQEVAATLKAEQAFFHIYLPDNRYMSAGTERHKRLPKTDTNELDMFIETYGDEIIVTDLLPATGGSVRRLLMSYRIALVLPLRQGDDRVGYLFLGDKKSAGYAQRDIQALITIRDELMIATQNALSVQEVRDLNATLQQRIDEATKELRASNTQLQRLDEAKDEFVSMASHQLRTPLTSVKGYISMVLDGDVGKISDDQKHLLSEAFTSSERMVHLINDFLNVSRLQTGKFVIDARPTNLSKVVEQELDGLESSARSRDLTFAFTPPKDFPKLNIDESKVRQVVMNFADNALYYSPENTTISVSLLIEGDDILFTVKDKGIGVPANEQARLFSKFYRASNARKQRPDGTGVGLFLAKKVITAHGGSVIFESKEGKGSTFGFRLPLARLRSASNAN